jgi:hypothetical protein
MTQTVIVALVVLAAVAFVARRAWATLRPKAAAGCGDGCGCGSAETAASGDWARS